MRFSKVAVTAALASAVDAQRPTNTSICDYYTGALLGNNTAENQLTVLTLLVNTVVIGNYSKPNIPGVTFPDVYVPGILKNGTVNGTAVNLLPYFNGGLASSNRGGSSGVAVNFLDDGGATPLLNNKPANGTSSNQYKLLTHLYQFFGTALGCSQQGMSGYPAYQGVASQYQVHKFMALDYAQVTYFIQNVALAAQSFGVHEDDIKAVGTLLNSVFNVKCAAPISLVPNTPAVEESICITSDCPLAANNSCSGYAAVVQPAVANATLAPGFSNGTATNGTSGTGSGSPSGSASPSPTTGAAAKVVVGGVSFAAVAVAALLL